MGKQRMTRQKWEHVLSAISYALDNDPTFIDDVGEYTNDGYELREAFSLIYKRYIAQNPEVVHSTIAD